MKEGPEEVFIKVVTELHWAVSSMRNSPSEYNINHTPSVKDGPYPKYF